MTSYPTTTSRTADIAIIGGGIGGVAAAGIDELAQVNGVSREMAANIYAAFHG